MGGGGHPAPPHPFILQICVIAKMRTEKGKQAFQNTGAKVWNELPDHVRRAPLIEFFKEKMRKMILED